VLKAGHHGSASSSGATVLARVRPTFAVLSCGRHNRFGHPDPGTLARLGAAGVAIERTDASGARWFELDDAGARPVDWTKRDPSREHSTSPVSPVCTANPPRRP
jgi:beta-lactamase superfamily II metal-dependent hydrolase